MKRRQLGMMPEENMGMGQEEPVMNPSDMGAQDKSMPNIQRAQPPQPQPQFQPLAPAVPGMEGMGAAMPGGGDAGTTELMRRLQSLLGGYR